MDLLSKVIIQATAKLLYNIKETSYLVTLRKYLGKKAWEKKSRQ